MFILQTDACQAGVGAVLSQMDEDGEEHAVAYASKKLNPAEARYATIELECLAIKWAVNKFSTYLLGKEFIIETDHAPLQWMNQCKQNSRVTRWALALQPYCFSIRHRPGKHNTNADALSRCVP